MQTDFAGDGGAMDRAGFDVSLTASAVAVAGQIVSVARESSVPIIFVGLKTSSATDSPVWRERIFRLGGDPAVEMAICRSGTPGANFVGPQPLPNDMVIEKTRYSAFFDTMLEQVLHERGIDTLLICGLTTESCIESTVRDAFHRDFYVFVIQDACAAYDIEVHKASIKSMALNCAQIIDSNLVFSTWGDGVRRAVLGLPLQELS